jgi:phosphoenolpyruvate carboxylase
MRDVSDLLARLEQLRERTNETPLFNPAFQLSLELSRAIESGALTLDMVAAMVEELECDALQSRAARLRRLVAPVGIAANLGAFTERLEAEPEDFWEFRTRWERPQLHCVFTAHPTFLLSPAESEAVAHAASQDGAIDGSTCAVSSEKPPITLRFEHERALDAIANAADARDRLVAALLGEAAKRWPDKWHNFAPLPFRFASWVGYDMDGRTDIHWYDSIQFRLVEKAGRLERYASSLAAIDPAHPLLAILRAAAAYASERAVEFAGDLTNPEALSKVANRLTSAPSHSRPSPRRCTRTGLGRAGSTSGSIPASSTMRSAG